MRALNQNALSVSLASYPTLARSCWARAASICGAVGRSEDLKASGPEAIASAPAMMAPRTAQATRGRKP